MFEYENSWDFLFICLFTFICVILNVYIAYVTYICIDFFKD